MGLLRELRGGFEEFWDLETYLSKIAKTATSSFAVEIAKVRGDV